MKRIRDARTADDFLSGLRGGDMLEEMMVADEGDLQEVAIASPPSVVSLLATDWLG